MSLPNEFLLERVVHHVLKADARAGRELLLPSTGSPRTAPRLIAEVLWPTMECVERLRADALIPLRTYNGAIRTLRGLLEGVERRLSREVPNGRSMMVLTGCGERGDLGADILSTLAEAQGWMVFFAGAGLSQEEVLHSLGQLRPDVLLVQGSSPEKCVQLQRLESAMRRAGLRPEVQLAMAGMMFHGEEGSCGADLVAAGPLEVLELLAMWPDYRGSAAGRGGLGFGAGIDTEVGLDHASIRRMILQHLRTRAEGVN